MYSCSPGDSRVGTLLVEACTSRQGGTLYAKFEDVELKIIIVALECFCAVRVDMHICRYLGISP